MLNVKWQKQLPKIERTQTLPESKTVQDFKTMHAQFLGSLRKKPGIEDTNYFDRFTKMYAELQYDLFAMSKRGSVKNVDKANLLEKEMKKICGKAAESNLPTNSIEKAKVLISKFNKLKTRGNYYMTTDEFADCEVHLVNESDSEAEQMESQLSDKIRLFIERNGPKAINYALSREQQALTPHLSHHISPSHDLDIPYLVSDCNVTQQCTAKYSKDKKMMDKVLGTEQRTEYRPGKDPPLSLHNVKRFGFWEAQLLSGEQPKNMKGKAFGSGETIHYYSIGVNEAVSIYSLKLCTDLIRLNSDSKLQMDKERI